MSYLCASDSPPPPLGRSLGGKVSSISEFEVYNCANESGPLSGEGFRCDVSWRRVVVSYLFDEVRGCCFVESRATNPVFHRSTPLPTAPKLRGCRQRLRSALSERNQGRVKMIHYPVLSRHGTHIWSQRLKRDLRPHLIPSRRCDLVSFPCKID